METHIWRHLRVELPPDWEMLQFSRDLAVGRCAFADRYQFRLELDWRRVDGPPDVERMVSDSVARLQADPAASGVERLGGGRWPGIVATVGGALTTRFGGYVPEERCVAELVFLWSEAGRDAGLEAEVVGSVRAEPARADGSRRWRALGMDLLASAGLALASCRAEPARASLLFASDGGARQEKFQRLGLVEAWLDGGVDGWLAGQLPKGGRAQAQRPAQIAGHEVALLAGARRVPRLGGFVSRPAPLAAAAWQCPRDGRLYCLSVTGREEADVETWVGRRLSCCDALELSA
jgi:hypothetical protein